MAPLNQNYTEDINSQLDQAKINNSSIDSPLPINNFSINSPPPINNPPIKNSEQMPACAPSRIGIIKINKNINDKLIKGGNKSTFKK